MEKLEELREFIDKLHTRIDYSDYLTLIDYVDEIYDEFNDVKQELYHTKSNQEWNKIELKKCNNEEREVYGTDFIWIGVTPEVDEEVLVTNGVDCMVDKWVDSAGVVYFDVMDDDVLWWMPLPTIHESFGD